LTNRRLLEQHRWPSDHRHQHQGLGATLLREALGTVTFASEQLAVRAVVVHAIDGHAARCYEPFGSAACWQ
jgi:histone acetyltransferase (RNA polymerase elongator complex component)